MTVNAKNPIVKGLSFSRGMSLIIEEIQSKNMSLRNNNHIRIIKTYKLRKLI